MELGRIDDGYRADRKLRQMQRMTPAERCRLREERRKRRKLFMEKVYETIGHGEEEAHDIYDPNDPDLRRFLPEDVEAARLHGISYHLLYYRVVRRGWTLEKAIRTPVGKQLWTSEDEEIVRLELLKGKSTAQISTLFPHRTQSAVKHKCSTIRQQLRKEGLIE